MGSFSSYEDTFILHEGYREKGRGEIFNPDAEPLEKALNTSYVLASGRGC